jgi:hypothetical protein
MKEEIDKDMETLKKKMMVMERYNSGPERKQPPT